MGRRRWQHYQQLLMENVQLKDEDRLMEEKDWESSDKCNFCDESSNTSQQTVDNIVPESKEQSKTKSHSSESSYETEDSEEDVTDRGDNLNFPGFPFNTSDIPESVYFRKNKLNSMSSLPSVASSVAASMAAVAAMNNISLQKSFGNLPFTGDVVPQWYLQQTNFALETAVKKDDSDTDLTDEQPLDLSAKSCSPVNSPTEFPPEASSPVFVSTQTFSTGTTSLSPSQSSLKVPVYNSNRHIFKAKPRLSPMAGRRTYTEEELQAALRDIQSGKLGTRRAAVIYGIPRSTLRNKVYKLALERERDNNTVILQTLNTDDRQIEAETDSPLDDKEEELEDRENENEEEDEEVEKELSATEEEKESEKRFVKPTFTVEDLIRFSKHNTAPLIENESLRVLFQQGGKFLNEQSFKQEKDSTPASPLPPPLYSLFPPGASEIWGNLDTTSIAPYLSHLMAATRDNFNISSMLGHPNPYFNVRNQNSSNDATTTEVTPSFSSKFPTPLFPELLQRMLAESEEQRKREIQNCIKTNESAGSFSSPPSDNNQEDLINNPASNILHRLPFFKPLYKNGSTQESAFCNIPDYNAENRISEESEKSVTSSPPPTNTTRSESSSPLSANHKTGLNLRDVIAKTIGQRFQQPQEMSISHIPSSSNIEGLHRLSFPSVNANSVIKSHSGVQTDDRKLCNQAKVPLSSAATSASNTASGGKGTRPKRGKYRNYDRDSLVEAVRAVQRGEMSVHRAGSYYGVPHSTLEYKVKERHLMRPRKREPKNQPEDLKRREDGSILRLSVNEKSAQHSPSSQPKISKSPFTPPSSLPTTPNGLKIPTLFEATHPFAPTTPFPFWPAPFHQLAMDYSRNSPFSSNPEHLLASHFVQRMQEESAKANPIPPALTALGKNAREVAESLYDGSGINGNFLDGVIRSSLDNDQAFSENVQKKNWLEQLCKNKYLNPNSKGDESDEEGNKPNINQILAHTLLSSVAAKDKSCTMKTSNDETKNDKEDQSPSLSGTKSVTEEENGKNEKASHENVPNQSLNVESQVINMKIKTEKN